MITAERTGRVARLVELDPLYCDLICRRYATLTDDSARLEASGASFEGVARPAALRNGCGPWRGGCRMSDLKPHTAGYMKPPVAHRFQKGKSGNPKGRSKTLETPYTALQKVLGRKVSLAGGGGKIPIGEALLLRLRELADTGDRRAVALQQRILAMARPGPPEGPRVNGKSAQDRFLEMAVAHPELVREILDN